jgi:hypothetical protein
MSDRAPGIFWKGQEILPRPWLIRYLVHLGRARLFAGQAEFPHDLFVWD